MENKPECESYGDIHQTRMHYPYVLTALDIVVIEAKDRIIDLWESMVDILTLKGE